MKRITLRVEHWIFLVGVALGILVAFPLAAPIFDAKIPDGAATLWGAALGAVIAIGGSFWVADRAQHSQQRSAVDLFFSIVDTSVFLFQDIVAEYGRTSFRSDTQEEDREPDLLDEEKCRHIMISTQAFVREYQVVQKRVARIDSSLHSLGASKLQIFLALEIEMDFAYGCATRLLSQIRGSMESMSPMHASPELRREMAEHAEQLNELLLDLNR
ncbi:hypothetical protein ACTOWA_23210 [Herbaspirillum seropedicae]|uniref:hypothetical protein n=1 Tax=Herbaspirillum seropedicae TaxID=964 RepID=UPI003F8D73A0